MLRDVQSPPARFMGGREYAAIAGAPGNPDPASLARVIASGAMALPCFAGQGGGGPFASREGEIREIRGETASADRLALATLYVALMSDLMLTRLGVTVGDLVVEGSPRRQPRLCCAPRCVPPIAACFRRFRRRRDCTGCCALGEMAAAERSTAIADRSAALRGRRPARLSKRMDKSRA